MPARPYFSQSLAKVGQDIMRDSSRIVRDHYQIDKAGAILCEDRMTDCPKFCASL